MRALVGPIRRIEAFQFLCHEDMVEGLLLLIMELDFDVFGRRRESRDKSYRMRENFRIHAFVVHLGLAVIGIGDLVFLFVWDEPAKKRDAFPARRQARVSWCATV